MYFLFLTIMNRRYIIHPSKRDTHKQISRCSLKIRTKSYRQYSSV
nr:MAG TPA: hypothetical protein [Caudoviricetes sp.]